MHKKNQHSQTLEALIYKGFEVPGRIELPNKGFADHLPNMQPCGIFIQFKSSPKYNGVPSYFREDLVVKPCV